MEMRNVGLLYVDKKIQNLRALLPHIIIFIVLLLFIYLILNCLGLTTAYYGYASLPHFEYIQFFFVSLMP